LVDPLGLNPAGAAIGGRIGWWLGGIGGEILEPVGGGVPGAALGGLAGRAIGDLLSNLIFSNAEDPVVYPDNPDTAPDDFERISGTRGKSCPQDGSVWERDHAGHGDRDGDGDGSQWKRWPNKKSWEKGRTPQSIWPDGRIRK
jgi:hypothetical protein